MITGVEDVNLAEVADAIKQSFGRTYPSGYLEGRTILRDAVAHHLQCSMLEAETIVDTMVSRGFLRYAGRPTADVEERLGWAVQEEPLREGYS